jgi:type I restriction enzyme S subunit
MSTDISIGEIPESWHISELGKVAKWGSGGTPKSGTSAFYGGGIPWAVIGDLTESWVSDTAQTITKTGLEKSSAKIIEPGTVMLAMYGASIGRTGIASVKMATNQAIAFAVPVEGIVDNQFLLKYLQSQKEIFVRAGQGGAQPNISQTVIKPWPIPLPPIAEQMKIIEILEEQLSRLDAALASVRAVREKSARFRRSLLHAAFSGALTGHDTSDGKLPKEWEEVEIGKLGHWLTGSTPSSKKPGCFGDSYPFVTPGDINAWGKLTKTARGLSDIGWKEVRVVSPPSVLLVCIGTIGKVSWSDIEVATNQQINALSIDADRHEPRFISLLFSSSSFQELLWDNSSSTTVSIINKGTLSKLVVSVPPLGEQKKIVEILEEQLSRLDASLAIADVVEKTASALRRSLLHAAFSGKLTKEWREGANV